VKEAAKTFVNALRPSDDLALLVFSDQSVLVHDLTTKRQATLESIDHYSAKGGTALNDALHDALSRLKLVDNRRAVVVLTDGRDENGPGTAPGSQHTIAEVLEQVRTVDAPVYGIGLGPKVDRQVLERLADASGGEAFFPETVATLAEQYGRVVESLRQRYIASYISTNSKRDGRWRAVDITSPNPELGIKSRGGYFAPEP
jgi:VWFA-related protein